MRCRHNFKCAVWYKAAKEYYKGQGKMCVQPGCNAVVKFSQLEEFHEFVSDLNARNRAGKRPLGANGAAPTAKRPKAPVPADATVIDLNSD